jgi:hypothetical protein
MSLFTNLSSAPLTLSHITTGVMDCGLGFEAWGLLT